MTPEDFVGCLFEQVIERNLAEYAAILGMREEDVCDERWKPIVSAFQQMDDEEQSAVKLLARQAAVDAVSGVLGVLDGTSILAKHREEFLLTYGSGGQKLNGDLQDLALDIDGSEDRDGGCSRRQSYAEPNWS